MCMFFHVSTSQFNYIKQRVKLHELRILNFCKSKGNDLPVLNDKNASKRSKKIMTYIRKFVEFKTIFKIDIYSFNQFKYFVKWSPDP